MLWQEAQVECRTVFPWQTSNCGGCKPHCCFDRAENGNEIAPPLASNDVVGMDMTVDPEDASTNVIGTGVTVVNGLLGSIGSITSLAKDVSVPVADALTWLPVTITIPIVTVTGTVVLPAAPNGSVPLTEVAMGREDNVSDASDKK